VAEEPPAPHPKKRVAFHATHREGIDAVGRVLLLAGRQADAVAPLRAAAASCSAIAVPIDHTHANLYLGQALEATGDTAGACAAYQVVLSRWGAAKPRSLSADLARKRARALGCEAPRQP
jgi:serine/threonine-protein kinase